MMEKTKDESMDERCQDTIEGPRRLLILGGGEMTPCSLGDSHQIFRGTLCSIFRLIEKWRQYILPKRW
jgi:hypothetical protein